MSQVADMRRPFLEDDAEVGEAEGRCRHVSPPFARVPSSGSSFFDIKKPSAPNGASVFSSVLSLLNTCMGTGLLALPAAFASVGYGSGCALTLLFAICTLFSLHLLEVSARTLKSQHGARDGARDSSPIAQPSFYSVCEAALPRAGLFVDMAVVINSFGALVTYLIVAADSVAGFAATLPPPLLNGRRSWTLLFVCAVGPICFLRRFDALRFISLLKVASLLVIAATVIEYSLRLDSFDPCPEVRPLAPPPSPP